ncbi:MobF family relaxase [Novosphingobium aerophilum]|uniref:Relaxase domain-containing protein n=1 Tax=Novosphingobium aerophilum TaxID=2839843 RepID=A0A7X1FA61_9SPHN|nr:MobF family relaxase [Novosphingobium aerophilum]MBC2653233.1 relaxase domain-containing protein [Novosphingobium aerophilum]
MLSVANVRSAGGAASYFAKDNYYAGADADRSGVWVGKGAERLSLSGTVEAAAFEAILRGELPGGGRIGREGADHRAGTDLTFSLPKSWSLLALVGKDERIIAVYRSAVIETLRWAETNAAYLRIERAGKERRVQTDNLTVALFQHDTNRNQEPNLHFHAVVANMTQGPDGTWKALRNDRLWALNTLLNAMTMARFRGEVEKLGYQIGAIGKHGNFEAAGIGRETVMAFSTRRQEVLDARRGSGLEAGVIATLATRSAKPHDVDRGALLSRWEEQSWGLGIDLAGMVRDAHERSAVMALAAQRQDQDRPSIAQRGRVMVLELAERLGIKEGDPLVPARIHLRPAQEIAAAHAVASAVRHLSEREAAFKATDLAKAALDLGLPTTMPLIEKRIGQLAGQGALSKGRGARQGWLTTTAAAALEARMLAEIERGRGAVSPILSSEVAGAQLQASASLGFGLTLNAGQEAAGRMILASANRIVAVQGVAGAGKSSLLRPLARILGEHGKQVIGLGVQNTLVRMLERETGIPSMTLQRFLGQHRGLLDGSPGKGELAEARAAYRDTVLVLDEASMVSTRDSDRLVRLANLLEVDRLVLMGDPKQLGAVEAGKPFALALAAGTETARMETNLRARSATLQRAQAAAQHGRTGEALEHLKDHIVEVSENSAVVAAERWLALPPAERKRTGIYVAGRQLRDEVNAAVQTGLVANGEIGPDRIDLTVLSRVNATREELRQVRSYAPGMVLELTSRQPRQRLSRGRYEIVGVDAVKGAVALRDASGRRHSFIPSHLGASGDSLAIQLHERKPLTLYTGDTIRWTANDHQRGMINADRATIAAITPDGLTVRTSSGIAQDLRSGDPMLARIDLAYALNAHMAQGLTSDKGIAVMDSAGRKLLSARNFLVTITRLRDELTLIVDNRDKVALGIGRNPGDKTSALEVTERLGAAATKGQAAGKPPEPSRQPELERTIERVRPFEIGL